MKPVNYVTFKYVKESTDKRLKTLVEASKLMDYTDNDNKDPQITEPITDEEIKAIDFMLMEKFLEENVSNGAIKIHRLILRIKQQSAELKQLRADNQILEDSVTHFKVACEQLRAERAGLLEWLDGHTKLKTTNHTEDGWNKAMQAIKSQLTDSVTPPQSQITWTGKNWHDVCRFINDHNKDMAKYALDPLDNLSVTTLAGREMLFARGDTIYCDRYGKLTDSAQRMDDFVTDMLKDAQKTVKPLIEEEREAEVVGDLLNLRVGDSAQIQKGENHD